jgi:hypothetical protein
MVDLRSRHRAVAEEIVKAVYKHIHSSFFAEPIGLVVDILYKHYDESPESHIKRLPSPYLEAIASLVKTGVLSYEEARRAIDIPDKTDFEEEDAADGV